MLVTKELIIVGNAAVNFIQYPRFMADGVFVEGVLRKSSVPFHEVYDPSQQDRRSLVNLEYVDWCQLFLILIQNF